MEPRPVLTDSLSNFPQVSAAPRAAAGAPPPRRAPAPWERLSQRPQLLGRQRPAKNAKASGGRRAEPALLPRGGAGQAVSGAREGAREVSAGRGAAGSAPQHSSPHTVPRRPWRLWVRLAQPAPRPSCPAGARRSQRPSPRPALLPGPAAAGPAGGRLSERPGERARRGERPGATRGSPPPGPSPGRCRHLGCAAGLRLEGDGGHCSAHPGRTDGRTDRLTDWSAAPRPLRAVRAEPRHGPGPWPEAGAQQGERARSCREGDERGFRVKGCQRATGAAGGGREAAPER